MLCHHLCSELESGYKFETGRVFDHVTLLYRLTYGLQSSRGMSLACMLHNSRHLRFLVYTIISLFVEPVARRPIVRLGRASLKRTPTQGRTAKTAARSLRLRRLAQDRRCLAVVNLALAFPFLSNELRLLAGLVDLEDHPAGRVHGGRAGLNICFGSALNVGVKIGEAGNAIPRSAERPRVPSRVALRRVGDKTTNAKLGMGREDPGGDDSGQNRRWVSLWAVYRVILSMRSRTQVRQAGRGMGDWGSTLGVWVGGLGLDASADRHARNCGGRIQGRKVEEVADDGEQGDPVSA